MKKKLGDMSVQLSINTEAFDKATEKINQLGEATKNIKLYPVSIIGSHYHQQLLKNEEREVWLDKLGYYPDDKVQTVINAYTPSDFSFKPLEPANLPIELRLEYQRQFWMRPIWWLQDFLWAITGLWKD